MLRAGPPPSTRFSAAMPDAPAAGGSTRSPPTHTPIWTSRRTPRAYRGAGRRPGKGHDLDCPVADRW